MIRLYRVLSVPFLLVFLFSSCRRINDSTELGGELIPDNINTFEVRFDAITDNRRLIDTLSQFIGTDQAALGFINDPEFGTTSASVYFDVSPTTYAYPFKNKPDSVQIDSVVLAVAYTGSYGDTSTPSTLKVYEIDPSSEFRDHEVYKFDRPAFGVLTPELGTKTFASKSLRDSITLTRRGVVTKEANVIRITLPNAFGQRLVDESAYKNDTTFNGLFSGFAIKADQSAPGNVLNYISLTDPKTRLQVYFRVKVGGVMDTTSASFFHLPTAAKNGKANIIERSPGGGFANYITNSNPSDEVIYLQSASTGSVAHVRIPQLDTLSNRVVHRAELVFSRVPAAGNNTFPAPSQLLLEKLKPNNDTGFLFERDMFSSGQFDLSLFGGRLLSDESYRFDITRHVQGIITRKEPNSPMRLSLPYEVNLFGSAGRVSPFIFLRQNAGGRVVLGGGTYPDPAMRACLRIIYSRL